MSQLSKVLKSINEATRVSIEYCKRNWSEIRLNLSFLLWVLVAAYLFFSGKLPLIKQWFVEAMQDLMVVIQGINQDFVEAVHWWLVIVRQSYVFSALAVTLAVLALWPPLLRQFPAIAIGIGKLVSKLPRFFFWPLLAGFLVLGVVDGLTPLQKFNAMSLTGKLFILGWGVIFAIGFFLASLTIRASIRIADDWLKSNFRRSSIQKREAETDIATISSTLSARPIPVAPSATWWYVQGKLVLGLDEFGKCLVTDFPLPHILFAGTSGAGKGIGLTLYGVQCALHYEVVVFFDPKNDEWAAHVFHYYLVVAPPDGRRRTFHFVDLSADVAQFNICEDASEKNIYEMLKGGLPLVERGVSADFYLGADRAAARKIAKWIATNKSTFAACFKALGGFLKEDAPKVHSALCELALCKSINARRGGFSIADCMRDGGVIYLVGSMRNDEIKRIQRMLLIRIIQLAESRDRIADKPRQIGVFLDEFKAHISRVSLESLSAARDKGVHVFIALQSIDDMRDVPSDLNADAVQGAIVQNCKLTVTYRVLDFKTAQWFAQNSGMKLIDTEIKRADTDATLIEVSGERSFTSKSVPFISENELMTLRNREAILFGLGLPQRIFILPLIAEKSDDAIRLHHAEGDDTDSDNDEVI